ncbi:hypothetical protein DdX_05985 [Ditylenchus destructor]|uniref:Uncharacterized protein n=1 Tax=Ditylenchus destructor TaxID=166010 RepID=A0AAD4N6S1_9BILA|nr:hypothetical protein DdX_05985 [Ditylenchus destructor]
MYILTKSIFLVALVAFSKAHPGWNYPSLAGQRLRGESGFPAFPPQGEVDSSEPMSQTEQQDGGDAENQEQQFVPNTGFFGEGIGPLISSDESDQPGEDSSPTGQHVARDNVKQGEERNGSDEELLENSLHPDKYPPEIDPEIKAKEPNEDNPFTRPRILGGHTDPFEMEEGHRPPSPTSSEELEPLPIVLPPPESSSSSEEPEEFPPRHHRHRFPWRHHRLGPWRRHNHGLWDEGFFMGPPPPPFGMFGMDFMPPMIGMPAPSPQIATPIIIQTAAAPAPPPPPPPQSQVIVLAGGSGSGALGGMLGLPQPFQATPIFPSPVIMGPPPPFFGGPDPGMFDMQVIEIDDDDDYDMGGLADFGMQESGERGRLQGLEDARPPFPFSGHHEGWRGRGRERRGGHGRRDRRFGRGFGQGQRNEEAGATGSGQLESGGSGPPPFMPKMTGSRGAPVMPQHHQRKR